jgi:hypothetical protein
MTKIQGKYNALKTIFDRLKLQGKDETRSSKPLIYNAKLICKDNKITCSVLNASCTVLGFFEFLNIKIVEEGTLAIGNIQEFAEFLSKFAGEEEVLIEVADSKLIITKVASRKNKKAYLNLIAEEHLDDSNRAEEALQKLVITENSATFNEVEMKNKFLVKTEDVREMLDDGNISTFTRCFELDFTPQTIKCIIGKKTENNIENEIPVISGVGSCKCFFNQGIDNVFSSINPENVSIFIEKESPMCVIAEEQNIKSKFVIAPAME